jgi:hypothetical protein
MAQIIDRLRAGINAQTNVSWIELVLMPSGAKKPLKESMLIQM